MKKVVSLKVEGKSLETGMLDGEFVDFVSSHLESIGMDIDFEAKENPDNSMKKFFTAYLSMANRYYNSEKEIEDILEGL